MTLSDYIAKWQQSDLKERSAAQENFLDLCAVLGQPTPGTDATGDAYAFEKGAAKTGGGKGFADVWKRGGFAWEYKGKRSNLQAAYAQLLKYREDLENPPLLVVCDLDRFEVHTNFTGTAKAVYAFTLADLAKPIPTETCDLPPLNVLRDLFEAPERLRPNRTTAQVTEMAAADFSRIAEGLRSRGESPRDAAQFLIRLLFCLFAEDIGLLPADLFTHLVKNTRTRPDEFMRRCQLLFQAMANGGSFGADDIKHFNGGLFRDHRALRLLYDELRTLENAAKLDWSSIEPSIFGTLFERTLDPNTRAQLGAHYTSREDILLIVEPVLMAPLRREWQTTQSQALALQPALAQATGANRTKLEMQARRLLQDFASRVSRIQVLDPACGSGNFLYVALRQLLDLEKEVIVAATTLGLSGFFPQVGPEQMHGLEINEYAYELAPVTVWIGYIQWLKDNGFGYPHEPILRPLDTIIAGDSILAFDYNQPLSPSAPQPLSPSAPQPLSPSAPQPLSPSAPQPILPEWPKADVIIGNPPFLGGKMLRAELGDVTVDALFVLYDGKVPHEADLVTYWFERARALVAEGRVQRVGLISTNSIRGGANRRVLERIKDTGNIFMAWSDREWVLNGAAVRVSMIGFDDGTDTERVLDGQPVASIHSDLTGDLDLTQAKRLTENFSIAFMGDTKGGSFDIPEDLAKRLLREPVNPNGRPNSDVVRPWINGLDIVRRPRGMYIIDFGVSMMENDAALYEAPFEYVRRVVKPEREKSRSTRLEWWLHERPRPDLRVAIEALPRFIATPAVAKHRIFTWVNHPTLPDHAAFVFARDDDYFFGVLHSKVHELWSLRMGTSLGVGNDPRYTATTTFETFPLPWSPGQEPADDSHVTTIADAASELVRLRDNWLNPPGLPSGLVAKRTLTNLYNQCPTWLTNAHARLNTAVLVAYGWASHISDKEILLRLLTLNAERG